MADFNPNKYQRIVKQDVEQPGFDPSAYQRISAPQTPRDRLMEGMRQRMASMEDFARGGRAGLQNVGAFATSGLPEGLQIPRYDPEPTSQYGQLPIEAGKIASSFIPGVGAERVAAAGLGAIKGLPQWLSRVGAGAAGGAASAPSVDVSPGVGAAIGGVAGAIPEALTGAMGKFLGRNVTPEQFESARQAVPPTIRAPIGELADSPRAKALYGGTRGIALSQAGKPYSQLYDHLRSGAQELVEGAPGVQNPSQFVYDELRNTYKAARENTRSAYSDLAKSADAAGTPFNRIGYDSALDDSIKEVNQKIKNKTTQKLYGDSLDALEDFKNTKINSFGDAVDIRPSINDLIEKSSKSDDKVSRRYFRKIKAALDDSIAESAAQNPALMDLHNTANNARIEQGTFEKLNRRDATPFYKIYSKDGSPDNLISSHIRTSTKGGDFSGLLSALTEKLSPQAKAAVAKSHLNPTDEASLAKQMSKLGKLSPLQREAMFGDKAPLAHDLTKLSNIFPSATAAGFTPLTGFTGAKQLQLLGEGAGVGAAAHARSPSLLGVALGLPVYGQLTQRALRSKAFKDAYAKYLKRKAGGAVAKSTNKERLARTLALAAAGGAQDGT